MSVTEVRQLMKLKYAKVKKVDDIDYELTERILKVEEQNELIINNLQEMNDRLQLELKAAVRRMAIKVHNSGTGGLLARANAKA